MDKVAHFAAAQRRGLFSEAAARLGIMKEFLRIRLA